MSGADRLRIVVSGMVAGVPGQGGATWAVLQYVLGLRELGHEVMLIEPVEDQEDPRRDRYFQEVVAAFGLEGRAALVRGEERTTGVSYAELLRFARSADLLVNIAGMLRDEKLTEAVPVRAYLDLDPAFTQLWQELDGIDMRLGGHTHFVTVGLRIGRGAKLVPDCGRSWITTLPPVVLTHWPPGGPVRHHAFTTVANWRGYGSIEYNGIRLGQKAHSVRELLEPPAHPRRRVLLALAIHPDERRDLDALAAAGWELADPERVAGTPEHYRGFVAGSLAELGVAKSGYVASWCGWFSDRSACYLASARPVVAQDTGFGAVLPTGSGLLAFKDAHGAAAAMDAVLSNPTAHRRAARQIAEEHLASDVVLSRLLDQLGATA